MTWRFSRRRHRGVEASPVVRGPNDDPSLTDAELLAQRAAWFEAYTSLENVTVPSGEGPHACPCCGFITLSERGGYEICPVCFWEDDGQDDHDADLVRGGPNGGLSLSQARGNYQQFGACEQRMLTHVRSPTPEEHPGS